MRRSCGTLLVLLPAAAFANTIVPANEFGALMNAYLFPLVIFIEWLIYRAHSLPRALRGAVVSNVITSAMGFALVLVSGGIATLGSRAGGAAGQALIFPLLHFAVTLATEQGINVILNRPKPWPFAAVLRANAVTYGGLMALNAVLVS